MKEQFMPILMLLFIWVVIGLPIALAKKASEQQKRNARQAAQKAPAEKNEPATPVQPAAERLTTLTSTISVTEHDDSIYQGSLNAVTGEGYDPCHDEQMAPLTQAEHADRTPRPAQAQAGLPFGWTGSEMVKGIVMSEILKRKH